METEEQSRSIEDIIKARIKEETWDDVVRKQALQPGRFKPKQAALSTEKSTEGLGEIYAREYEQEILGARPADETNKAHEVARELFAKLSARLDQLTSFHFVPKPFQGTEAKVRANPNPNPNPTQGACQRAGGISRGEDARLHGHRGHARPRRGLRGQAARQHAQRVVAPLAVP